MSSIKNLVALVAALVIVSCANAQPHQQDQAPYLDYGSDAAPQKETTPINSENPDNYDYGSKGSQELTNTKADLDSLQTHATFYKQVINNPGCSGDHDWARAKLAGTNIQLAKLRSRISKIEETLKNNNVQKLKQYTYYVADNHSKRIGDLEETVNGSKTDQKNIGLKARVAGTENMVSDMIKHGVPSSWDNFQNWALGIIFGLLILLGLTKRNRGEGRN